MATNNDGHQLDSSGNVAVDFVWGNFPLQPNDVRTENPLANFGGTNGSDPVTVTSAHNMRSVPGEGADIAWSATTRATATRLDFAGTSAYSGSNVLPNVTVKSVHELAETEYASYPTYVPAAANYMVTAASGDGTTITYTALNWLKAGDAVNITGLTVSGFNLSGATVASANRASFTVTNSTTGSVTGQRAKAEYTTALTGSDGSYVAGVAYIKVPSVIGLTTTLAIDALKDAGYTAANITTATAATNTAKTVTAVSRASGGLAVLTASGAGAAYAIGSKVTIASVDATVNGTYTVVDNATNTFTVATPTTTSLSLTGLSGTVVGVTGTIKAQSVAAGTASVALGTTITVTPWA